VTKLIPARTPAENAAGLKARVELAKQPRHISVQEADSSDEVLAAYRVLDDAGQLTARVVTP